MARRRKTKRPSKPKIKPKELTQEQTIDLMFGNVLKNMEAMENAIRSLDGALSSYIEFHGDGKEWREWVEKTLKKQLKEKENENKS